MDRFLLDQNIVLYRRLRNSSTSETERRVIFELLAEVMDDFKMSKNEHQLALALADQQYFEQNAL